MRIVFAALPAYGHVYPMMPLALAFAEAGAEVTFATGEPFVDTLPLPTAAGITPGWLFADGVEETTRRLGPRPDRPSTEFANTLFAEVHAAQAFPHLMSLIGDLRPDLLIAEHTDVAALIAADLLDVPRRLFGITDLGGFAAAFSTRACQVFAEEYDARGRTRPQRLEDLVSSRFEIFPGFLQEPGTKPALEVVPLRPVGWSEHTGVPTWLRSPGDRPRAYLTLGTVFTDGGVLARSAHELVAAGFDVLMTLGPLVTPDQLASLPDGVHVEQFVDQPTVLDLVDVVVHHGGSGTALGALSAGLPQVVIPKGADQFWNAKRPAVRGPPVP
jgi:hypothetical protein